MVLSQLKLIWEPPNRLGRRTRKIKLQSNFLKVIFLEKVYLDYLTMFGDFRFFSFAQTPSRYLRTVALKTNFTKQVKYSFQK